MIEINCRTDVDGLKRHTKNHQQKWGQQQQQMIILMKIGNFVNNKIDFYPIDIFWLRKVVKEFQQCVCVLGLRLVSGWMRAAVAVWTWSFHQKTFIIWKCMFRFYFLSFTSSLFLSLSFVFFLSFSHHLLFCYLLQLYFRSSQCACAWHGSKYQEIMTMKK